MTRFSCIHCLPFTLALLLGGVQPARADPVLPLMPADTSSFMCFDVEKMLRSELFQKYFQESLSKDASLKQFAESTGIKNVKRIVAATATSRKEGKFPGGGLFIIVGEFVPNKLLAVAKELTENEKVKEYCAIVQEKGHTLIRVTIKWGETIELYGAVVDTERLIFGMKDDVLNALDRAAKKGEPVVRKKALVDRYMRIDPSTVLYAYDDKFITPQALEFIEGLKKLETPFVDPAIAKLLQKVVGVQFEVRVSTDIKLRLTLELQEETDAKELRPLVLKMFEKFKALLDAESLQYPKLKPLEEVGKNMKLTRTGSTILIETSLSENTLVTLFKQGQE